MYKHLYYFFIATVFLIGCKSKQTVVTTKPTVKPKVVETSKIPTVSQETTTKPTTSSEVIVSTSKTKVSSEIIAEYVLAYKNIAMSNMKSHGIPASIILAQGILESGSGKGDLALTANNHFGIKCHENWKGETIKHDDDAPQECFRKYQKPDESYRDHSLFLTGRPRYAGLFQLDKGDYKGWAKGLRAKGYATDPKYPDKLIYYIEKYKLYYYDNQVLGIKNIEPELSIVTTKTPSNSQVSISNPDRYEVVKGDTLYNISKRFNVSMEKLKEMNPVLENGLHLGDRLILKAPN
jgi:flagellum-specific peptidoglycan hydrolase FlgJ